MWEAIPATESEPGVRLYVAETGDGETHPSLVVIHEAFGVDEHIRDITERFAREGFFAVAPDLFSVDAFGKTLSTDEIKEAFRIRMSLPADRRTDPSALEEALGRLAPEDAERNRRILDWMRNRDVGALVRPLERVVQWAREQQASTDKVGVVGFCFGGGMTSRLAFAGSEINAAAPFYGQNPPLEQAANVRCPMLFMYGREDPFIMPGVPDLLRALEEAKIVYGLHIFEDAGHAFMNDIRPDTYSERAAREAWPITIDFFRRYLA